jgi:predicted DNA-binding WGR domain protein
MNKSICLHFQNDSSDKVYNLQLKACGEGRAIVEFQWGKRGTTLNAGTKTKAPVPLDEAEEIYAAVLREKLGKGYKEVTTNGAAPQHVADDITARAELKSLHPRKTIVTRETARLWSPAEFLIQRKLDGCFATRQHAGYTLLGELVSARSGAFLTTADRALIAKHTSFFAAFTVSGLAGANMLEMDTRTRWRALQSLARGFPADMVLAETVSDVDAVFAAGGEGCVAHPWGGVWPDMLACKVNGIYLCRVVETGATQSVRLCDAVTGQDRGSCKMGGGKCDQVRARSANCDGSVIRVESMGLTESGKLRQPVLASEWLVQF